MKIINRLLILSGLSLFLATCKKSGGNGAVIKIEGFATLDYNGNSLGQVGPADSDWTFMTGLSQKELALFNFDTGLSLDNTVVAVIPNNVIAFPNPFFGALRCEFGAQDTTVVKLVVVDSMLQVRLKKAFRIKGSWNFQLDMNDHTVFPDHSSFRIYYSFSAKDHPEYKVGYGDIRVCSAMNLNNCF